MSYTVRVAKKRPYWIDSLEDRPSLKGFELWKTEYFTTSLPTESKFNFVNLETLEWISTDDTKIYEGYFFEITKDNFTYYYYVNRIETLGNKVKKYILQLDHWTSFSLKIMDHMKKTYTGPRDFVFLKRGHYQVPFYRLETWKYHDERMEQAYLPTGRVEKATVDNNTSYKITFLNVPGKQPEMLNMVYMFHNDNVDMPFRFYPLVNRGANVSQVAARDSQGVIKNVDLHNNEETLNQLISRTGTGPNVSKFKGIFACPSILLFPGGIDTSIIRGKNLAYFEMKQFINQPEHVIDSGISIKTDSLFLKKKIITPYHEEFWKLNETRHVKSLKIYDIFKFRLYGTNIELSKSMFTWAQKNSGNYPKELFFKIYNKHHVIFSGGFHCIINNNNGPDENVVSMEIIKDRYNYGNRIISLPLELPSTTSEYLQYVNSVKNTTNTGFNNFKRETIINGTKTASNDLFNMIGGASKALGSGGIFGIVGAGASIGKGLMNIGLDIASSIVRVQNKERLIKANFQDKQNSSALTVHTSNVEDILNGQYMNEIGNVKWLNNIDLADIILISDEITDDNLMKMNNIVVKYGFILNKHVPLNYFHNEIDVPAVASWPFKWIEWDGEYLLDNYYSKLSEALGDKISQKYIVEFIDNISSGLRLWDKDFGYEYVG